MSRSTSFVPLGISCRNGIRCITKPFFPSPSVGEEKEKNACERHAQHVTVLFPSSPHRHFASGSSSRGPRSCRISSMRGSWTSRAKRGRAHGDLLGEVIPSLFHLPCFPMVSNIFLAQPYHTINYVHAIMHMRATYRAIQSARSNQLLLFTDPLQFALHGTSTGAQLAENSVRYRGADCGNVR